jgi:membrane protein implicated in regulation of membrane protease activity
MPNIFAIGFVAMVLAVLATPAAAYVGPGAGLGLLGAFWALLTAIMSSLAFLVIWPLRRRLRRRKDANRSKAEEDARDPEPR